MPMASIAEEQPQFGSTFFDLNANGLDDRIEPLINIQEEIDVILMFNERPAQLHYTEIKNIGIEITHIYKYIDALRLDGVSSNQIYELTKITDIRIVEWQAPVHTFLDTAASAIKVRESSEYSPVVWDNNVYGEGINVAVLDTGVDNEHETFDVFEDQGVRRFIAGMNCDGGCPTDDAGNYQFTTDENSNEDPDDFDGHGTHVASTVLGMGGDTGQDGDGDDDGDGIQDYLGIAPAARLIDMKVMADWGSGSSADINEAIEACIENVDTDWENDGEKNNGVHVMSMSLGTTSGSDGSDSQSQLVNQANAAGIVVVIAMGNDGEEEVPSPASADWSVAVGAMDNMNN
ncbi:MAG: S8 family serine peptidase, partial [Candidatus Poseidoniales archaeon]|nr:S8 family serine peptidase [Candidatus Poseidoniales archaeon]